MSAHTDGPWRINERHHGEIVSEDFVLCLMLSTAMRGQNWHIDWNTPLPHSPEAQANAEFIVRACNAHYELLSVMLDMFENPNFQVAIGGNPSMVDALMERARAAIAKAKATTPSNT